MHFLEQIANKDLLQTESHRDIRVSGPSGRVPVEYFISKIVWTMNVTLSWRERMELTQRGIFMLKESNDLNIQEGYIRVLNKMTAEYHQINRAIRVKASGYQTQKKIALGKQIILTGHKPVEKGALIQLKFDLKCRPQNKFGVQNAQRRRKNFIGIGQVLKIFRIGQKKYKMLVLLLDLCSVR